jgi:hypothetical protein
MKGFIYIIIFIFITSCQTKIKEEDKIYVIGKIVNHYGKNSRRDFVYFYNGILFKSSDMFNTVEFGFNDKFLMYINKNKPQISVVPYPTTKIIDSVDLKELNLYFYKDFEKDYSLLNSYIEK